MSRETVAALLRYGAATAPAIAAPGLPPLTYDGLRILVDQTVRRLNSLGIGRNDRVAIVLPNGPHAAAAFIAVAAGATTAPLNPTYRSEEFEFYLTDLKAKALIVEHAMASPVRDIAAHLNVPILELHPDPQAEAGVFTLESVSPIPQLHPLPERLRPAQSAEGGVPGAAAALGCQTRGASEAGPPPLVSSLASYGAQPAEACAASEGWWGPTSPERSQEREPAGRVTVQTGMAEPDDIALVLHTSGTTSRPKIVPLTQRNITASARHIVAALELSPADICLNIMPLFHIHGLMAAVLASLAAGAQVSCSSGFNALKFCHWLDEVKPTWYTAAPSMHRAILGRAARHPAIIAQSRLRLIRSSSAALRPQLMAGLQKTFRTPVIQSYGMTEASHQVASNPLSPRVQKPGSVGLPAGPDVAIMDDEGTLLPVGQTGEVVIRGPNVTAGYEANPDANRTAFINGWFRSGDQGRLDSDGYLWLTGRLKELINRGGEKVSPLEIEAVLMDHPEVQQVVTFAMPDDSLGEEIAAAVVRREGSTLSDRDLRRFAATHLADFKVPRKIVFVSEIPKGATGKLQRVGLAEKLGLT